MKLVHGKKKIYVDNEESLVFLIDNGFIKFEGRNCFILHTDAIQDKISELEKSYLKIEEWKKSTEDWKNFFYNEKKRAMELEEKLRELENKDIVVSIDSGDRDSHGRFIPGHKVDLPRDNKGKFVKKDK